MSAAPDRLREVQARFTVRPRIPMSVPDRIADEIDDIEIPLFRSQDARHCLFLAEEQLKEGGIDGYPGEIIRVEIIASVLSDDAPGAMWTHPTICEWEGAWVPSTELLADKELLPTVLRILSAPEGTDRWAWAMLTIHAASSGGRVPAWCDDCAAEDACAWEQVVKTAMLGIGLPRG